MKEHTIDSVLHAKFSPDRFHTHNRECELNMLCSLQYIMHLGMPFKHQCIHCTFYAYTETLSRAAKYQQIVKQLITACCLCTGNMMTLSYSVGLTTGSAVAYLLNSWLGPYSSVDPCQQLNLTSAAVVTRSNLTMPYASYDLRPSTFYSGWCNLSGVRPVTECSSGSLSMLLTVSNFKSAQIQRWLYKARISSYCKNCLIKLQRYFGCYSVQTF